MSTLTFKVPDIHYGYYLIIPHPSEQKFLVTKEIMGWTLPHFIPDEHHRGVVNHINQAALKQFNIRVTTCQAIDIDFDSNLKRGSRAYIMDNLDPDWQPSDEDTRWASLEEMGALDLAVPKHLEILEQWLEWIWARQKDPARVPWSRLGWFNQAEEWIKDQLGQIAVEVNSIKQQRSWVRSCVMRVETDDTNYYFKAVPSMFSYEPVISRVLALRHPRNSPDVVAVDINNAWLLMREFEGTPLNRIIDLSIWENALKTFAEIQIDLVPRTQNLIGLGFPDRHVDQMVSQLDHLLNDLPQYLNEDEVDELESYRSQIRDLCWELLEYDIPLSLGHGDFWAGNVMVNMARCVFFDWSESSVTHPFFDLAFFMSGLNKYLSDNKTIYHRLRDAYLEPWVIYMEMDKLINAFELAKPLTALHHVMIYKLIMLPTIEDRAKWEMDKMIPFWLRVLIDNMREYSTGYAR